MKSLMPVLMISLISVAVRVAPLATPKKWRQVKIVQILGITLPPVLMILLVFQSIQFTHPIPPQCVGILITALVHLWQRKMFLSIACGVITYILTSEVMK